MKMKKKYYRPVTAVTRVELESPICGGSVAITNPDDKDFGRILEQETNPSFDAGSQTGGTNNGWEIEN